MAFHGKVAVVTGGGSGMGQISARRLADWAEAVCILDINEEGMAETARGRRNVHPYVCDVSDPERVDEVFADIRKKHGPIDRLTHAAAIMPASPVAEHARSRINKLMRINYEGTVNMITAVLPEMLERKTGDLMIFGSLAGHVLTPHLGAYCATKAAVNALVEVLIEENRGSGVRIMLICPPMTDTPLISQATSTSNPRSIQLGIEQGRMADPHQVVADIEEALDKGKEIFFPSTEGKVLFGLRRFAPKLLWKVIWKAENS